MGTASDSLRSRREVRPGPLKGGQALTFILLLIGASILPLGNAFHHGAVPPPLTERWWRSNIVVERRPPGTDGPFRARTAAQQQSTTNLIARSRGSTTSLGVTTPASWLWSHASANTSRWATLLAYVPPLVALSLSTCAGAAADKSQKASGSGILVTLGASSILSNALGTIDRPHRRSAQIAAQLGNVGWVVFLPASLVFLLLSLGQSTSSDGSSRDSLVEQDDAFPPSLAIKRLAVPFAVACLGSVIGCATAFFLSRLGWRSSASSLWSRALPQNLLMPPREAAIAASCLVASFVGGSVNFFATAAIVVGPGAPSRIQALVASLASVDLLVMAVYFASLGALLQSKALRKWFGEQLDEEVEASPVPSTMNDPKSNAARSGPIAIREVHQGRMQRWQADGVGVALASALALQVVRLARCVERLLEPIVPGTACAFIAIVVPLLQRFPFAKHAIWKNMQRVSQPLATYSFLWLFATIGMSIDITEALREGPACLVYSAMALCIHVAVTLLGCWILGARSRQWHNRARNYFVDPPSIRVEEALIASNAAIGGPATAAAFCGRLVTSGRRKAGLTVAATVYGVVGYAIGTTLGVTMFRWLNSLC